MKIRVEKLRKNLTLLQPVVPRKPTLQVLANIRLADGKITGTDLEVTVSISLPESQGEAFLLPFNSVMELLKYVPGDEMLSIESGNKNIKLSWNGGTAAYDVPDIQDYPEITLQDIHSEDSLNGDLLISALESALPYCATDGSRPVLGGITLYLGTVLQIAAADGFRLSFQSLKLSYPTQQTIVIPANTVSVLEHLWRREPARVGLETTLISQLTQARKLQFSVGNGNIGVRFGNINLISKLIEGTPPDHLALLNNFQEPIKAKLMAPDLYHSVRRLEGIARDGTGIVRLQWTDSRMIVSARSEEKGEIQAEIAVEAGSNPGKIALNIQYLTDYLAAKDGQITIGTTNTSSPAIFHYGTKPIVAIMPMNVQWNDEKLEEDSISEESEVSEVKPDSQAEEKTHADTVELSIQKAEETNPDLNEPQVEPSANAPQPKPGKRKREAKRKDQ